VYLETLLKQAMGVEPIPTTEIQRGLYAFSFSMNNLLFPLQRSAQYLRREMPIRIAHRCVAFCVH
jgi:hypothetical protein